MKDGEIPTRENCDPSDPEEMFLWCFVGLPGMRGAPLLLPPEYYRQVSQRLYELGARLVEEPTLKYKPPAEGKYGGMTAQGKWVDIDEPDTPQDEVAAIVQRMSPAIRQAVVDEAERLEGRVE